GRNGRGGRAPQLVTSDEYAAYPEALLTAFGEEVVPPRTGKPGRPAGPRLVPPEGLCHATVHKTRAKGRVVAVTARVVRGEPPAGGGGGARRPGRGERAGRRRQRP